MKIIHLNKESIFGQEPISYCGISGQVVFGPLYKVTCDKCFIEYQKYMDRIVNT